MSEQSNNTYRELYHDETSTSAEISSETITPSAECVVSESEENTISPLLDMNPDICGWLNIPGTNIDYPVVFASKEKTDYYLTHNIDGIEDKNGTLFLDYRTELTQDSKVLVINGHNMSSTGLMFHDLEKYKSLDFYQQNPVITFDTILGDSQWKIISLIKTNNNEKDTLLILSTCTYEMNDMRFLVVARKVRDNEDPSVDTTPSYKRENVLYPDGWYTQYGGTKPNITSFTNAYNAGDITWYDGGLFK